MTDDTLFSRMNLIIMKFSFYFPGLNVTILCEGISVDKGDIFIK